MDVEGGGEGSEWRASMSWAVYWIERSGRYL